MNKYYVYAHKEQDKIVYIGYGSNNRAWDCTENTRRKSEHGDWMRDQFAKGNMHFVHFFNTSLSRKEARDIEKKLIQEYQPKHNTMNTKKASLIWSKRRGEASGNHKLNEQQVKEIRASKKTGAQLAKEYNVSSPNTIYRIKKRQTWTHI